MRRIDLTSLSRQPTIGPSKQMYFLQSNKRRLYIRLTICIANNSRISGVDDGGLLCVCKSLDGNGYLVNSTVVQTVFGHLSRHRLCFPFSLQIYQRPRQRSVGGPTISELPPHSQCWFLNRFQYNLFLHSRQNRYLCSPLDRSFCSAPKPIFLQSVSSTLAA